MDARLVAHLADVAPQDWAEEIRRFEAVNHLFVKPRPGASAMRECADALGLKMRALYRVLDRQRAIHAGTSSGNRRLDGSLIATEADGLINAVLDELGDGATLEKLTRLARLRFEREGLPLPSSSALRHRLHRRPSNSLRPRLLTDADVVIDMASLHVTTDSDGGPTTGVQLLVMADAATGHIFSHSLHERKPSETEIMALVTTHWRPRSSPLSLLLGTSSIRNSLQRSRETLLRAGFEIDGKTRVRSGEALIAMFGLRIGRIRVDLRRAEAGRCILHPLVPPDVLQAIVAHIIEARNAKLVQDQRCCREAIGYRAITA
jgi:hypothetical protein